MSGTGFSFGTAGATGGGGGFSFGTPASNTATAAATTTAASGFSFSAPTTTAATSGPGEIKFMGFQATTAAATPATSTAPTSTAAAPFSFNFNASVPSNTTSASTATTTSLFNIGSTTNAATSSTGLTFGTGSGFSFAKTTSAPAAVTTTGTGFFSFTPTASTTVSVSGVSPAIFSTCATLSTATTTTTFGASGAGGATNLSMRQLEEKLNKWLVELKEQEERFLRQAAHVNAWDQILQNGHDQVQSLKDTLHTVKSDQSRLEAEIDFIRGQQEELERLLEPLEAATNANPSTQLHQGDRQRDNMYYMAQSLDAQLRQMTDDLGKVIDHLNTNSGALQPNDPVAMVAKILSAHMDTLKWVDQNTSLLSQKMDQVARVASGAGRRG